MKPKFILPPPLRTDNKNVKFIHLQLPKHNGACPLTVWSN